MRILLLLAAALVSGCLAPLPSDRPDTWFYLDDHSLRIEAPWVEGDQVLAIHVEAEQDAWCGGMFSHGSDQTEAVASTLLDTGGTSGVLADAALVAAYAGPLRNSLFFGTPSLVMGTFDPSPFEGERWIWLVMPGVASGDMLGGIDLVFSCEGARIVAVLAGHANDAMHWNEAADAAVLALDYGAWAMATEPAEVKVEPSATGALAVFTRDSRGATVHDGPEGPSLHDHRDGFLIKDLEEGTHHVRAVGQGRPAIAVLAAAAPVADWAEWFDAPADVRQPTGR